MWPKVTVVIVNWNGEGFLDRCLSALLAQTIFPHEIILVDNASSDASPDIVRRFPSVRLLAQSEKFQGPVVYRGHFYCGRSRHYHCGITVGDTQRILNCIDESCGYETLAPKCPDTTVNSIANSGRHE